MSTEKDEWDTDDSDSLLPSGRLSARNLEGLCASISVGNFRLLAVCITLWNRLPNSCTFNWPNFLYLCTTT